MTIQNLLTNKHSLVGIALTRNNIELICGVNEPTAAKKVAIFAAPTVQLGTLGENIFRGRIEDRNLVSKEKDGVEILLSLEPISADKLACARDTCPGCKNPDRLSSTWTSSVMTSGDICLTRRAFISKLSPRTNWAALPSRVYP